MAGVFGVRNIAAAAGVDPQEVVVLLRSGDSRRLVSRVQARWERQCFEEQPSQS